MTRACALKWHGINFKVCWAVSCSSDYRSSWSKNNLYETKIGIFSSWFIFDVLNSVNGKEYSVLSSRIFTLMTCRFDE